MGSSSMLFFLTKDFAPSCCVCVCVRRLEIVLEARPAATSCRISKGVLQDTETTRANTS